MLFDNMFIQNEIIGSALQASVLRNQVIQNNIANAEVPGFKKSAVSFETSLAKAVDEAKKTGKLDLRQVMPSINKVNTNFSYRLDGNNVDIEEEMVNLYENSVKYDAMVSMATNNIKRLSLVLSK